MPRVKSFSKEEVLQKAMELFWEKGYSATSLNDLTSHLGIGKGSFYATFRSKQALFEEALEFYKNSRTEFLEQMLNSEPDVKIGIRKLLLFNLNELLADDKHKGCFIANTCSEFSGTQKFVQDRLIEHYNFIQETITTYLLNGDLNTTRATTLASIMITYMTGLSQQAKFKKDKEDYLNAIEYLMQLLD